MAANYDSFDVMNHCIKYSWGFLIPPDLFDNDYINKENHPIIYKLHDFELDIFYEEFYKKCLNKISNDANYSVISDTIINVQLRQIDYLRSVIKKAILDKPNNEFDYAANNMLNEFLKRLNPLDYAIKNYRDKAESTDLIKLH